MDDFQRWLQAKYDTPAALSGAWRRPMASFAEAARPDVFAAETKEDLPPYLDRAAFDDAPPEAGGTDVLDYLGMAPSDGERTLRKIYERIRLIARELVPTGQPHAVSHVVDRVAPTADPAVRHFAIRAALMHGAAADAHPATDRADDLAALNDARGQSAWHTDRKMLILYPRVYAYLKHSVDSLAVSDAETEARTFGFERSIQTEGPALLLKFTDLATRARFTYAVGDTRMPLDAMRRFPLIICPTMEVLSAAAMRTLDAYTTGGGFLALGPRIPLVDETMQSNDTLARYFGAGLSDFSAEVVPCGGGALLTLPGYVSAGTIEFLAFESGMAKGLVADGPGVDSTVHRSGGRRLLFAANPNDYAVTARVYGEPFKTLVNVDTAEEVHTGVGTTVTVPPTTVTIWQVA